MGTNYFNPVTYLQRRPTQTAVQLPPVSFGLPAQNPNWTNVTGWSATGPVAAPNRGAISMLLSGLYGSGTPGQAGYVPGINERAATAFGSARNNARDALRGYGGVSFRQDDTSTPNVDESLMAEYNPDAMGRNERRAVINARAQASARGVLNSGAADQMVGAALQRVGEEARQIVNQYATQINQISSQYFDPITGQVNQTLGQIESLYGADTRWALEQEQLRPPAPDSGSGSQQPGGSTPAPDGSSPGGSSPGGPQTVWMGRQAPNMQSLRKKHRGRRLRVFKHSPMGNDNWSVVAE